MLFLLFFFTKVLKIKEKETEIKVYDLAEMHCYKVMETLDYLTGKYREPRLHQVTLELGANMLTLGGLYQDKASAIKALEHSLSSGKAAEIFARMVSALGGPADLIEKPQQYLASAPVVQDVVAPADGYVSYQDTVALGMAVVRLGGGRSHPSQQIDPAVGFSQIAAAGTQVRRGDVLARVHAASNDAAQVAGAEYLAALRINAAQQAAFPLLHHTIG